jgi:uncharacterized protein (TIGR00251 family)
VERIRVKVTPNAKRSEIVGWQEHAGVRILRIKLAAPPLDGKAKKALIEFIADVLGTAKREVTIVTGESQRLKTVGIPDGVVGRFGA